MVDDYYDSIAPSYDALHGEEQDRKLGELLGSFPVSPGSRVLDVGCGTGRSIVSFKGCVWHGIEPSEGLIAHAHPDAAGRITKGVAEELPFTDHSADVVVSLTVLQNVRDPEASLREMARVCAPNGRILISFLKKSSKARDLLRTVHDTLNVIDAWEEQQDHCFVCAPR